MQGALEGIKIVDFGIFFAGPYASKMLAEMGASVIKVEALTGDPLRRTVGAFNGCQRGKRSIAINLRTEEGKAIAHRLMAEADIVQHNMRPGVAERLGIDFETAKRLRSDVIYLYSPAFGTVGPRKDQPGFEPLVSALVGIETSCAGKGNPPVTTLGNMDYGNGLMGAAALLMALIHRAETGEGQYLECPQMVSGMVFTADTYFLPDGSLAPRSELDERQTGYGPLCRLYETREGWICIVVAKDEEWRALCAAIDRPALADDHRFAAPKMREANADALAGELGHRFMMHAAEEWQRTLDAAGVPCEISTSNGAERYLNDPENRASGLVAEYEHPQYGLMHEVGLTVRLSDSGGVIWGPPPLIGQHTREILAEYGFAEHGHGDLKDREIVTWPAEEPAKV